MSLRRLYRVLLPLGVVVALCVGKADAAIPGWASKKADSLINAGMRNTHFPGAQLVIGDRKGVLYAKDYGYLDYNRTDRVGDGTLYDIASCTKIVATTLVMMHLYDLGWIDLDSKVGRYLKEYKGRPVGEITLKELLTHTSGFSNIVLYPLLCSNADGEKLFSRQQSDEFPHLVDSRLYMCCNVHFNERYMSTMPVEDYRQIADNLFVSPDVDSLVTGEVIRTYDPVKRGRYIYCDTNFHLLKLIVESITGKTIDVSAKELFGRMAMERTGYRPLQWADTAAIAPTEEDYLLRRGLVRGFVHDELAAISGGVGGNAGVFSCAGDLGHYCEMLLNRGVYHGDTILTANVIRVFTSSPYASRNIARGMGFDKRNRDSALYGGYGHTGFTGTFIWIDPALGRYMVFLSNRVNPSRTNQGLLTSGLRTQLWEICKTL